MEWVAVAPVGGAIASADRGGTLLLRPVGASGPAIELAGPGRGASDPRFSPDGRLLAAFETDGTGGDRPLGIALWDARSGVPLRGIAPEDVGDEPIGFAFLDDGLFATFWARPDGEEVAHTWELDDSGSAVPGAPIPVPPGGAVAAGGGILATADGRHLAIHDPRTGSIVREFATAFVGIPTIALADDGRTVAIGDASGVFRLIDAGSGSELAKAEGCVPPKYLRVAPGGTSAALVGHCGTVYLLDRAGGPARVIRPDERDIHYAVQLAFSPDGRRVALSCYGHPGGAGPATIWGVADGRRRATYPGRVQHVNDLAFGPDGEHVMIAVGLTIRRWRIAPPADPPHPLGHRDEAWAVAFRPDGRILATGSDDDGDPMTLKLWDVATGALIAGWRPHPATVAALAFNPDGSLLASAALEPTRNLRLWDPATRELVAELEGHTDKVRTVAFSPDGRLLASAGSDRTIRLWDVAGRHALAVLPVVGNAVRRIAFSPDGRTLASCDNDGEVRLWDLATKLGRVALRTGSEPLLCLAFSPDGRTLAASDEGGSVRLLDLESGTVRDVLRGGDGEVFALAFSPDGRALAAAGMSRVVRIWDPVAGQAVLTLHGHEDQVNGLTFSPDSRTLASCSHEGAVRLWRSAPAAPAPSIARRPR